MWDSLIAIFFKILPIILHIIFIIVPLSIDLIYNQEPKYSIIWLQYLAYSSQIRQTYQSKRIYIKILQL